MKRFFHVDRAKRLSPGYEVALQKIEDHWSTNAAELNCMFPDGVTKFGAACLCEKTAPNPMEVIIRERSLEHIRRQHYPNRLSRLASFFAWGTTEEAFTFRAEAKSDRSPIWLVECESYDLADMTFTKYPLNSSLINCIPKLLEDRFHRYWKGDESESPRWERLLKPPVAVLEQVF